MASDTGTRCGRLAAWSNAVLVHRCPEGAAVEAVVGDDELHEVVDLPGSVGRVPLAAFLDALRQLGVTGLRTAPAAPGDVSALPGPVSFNERALAAGGAVLTVGRSRLGLVPVVERHGPQGDAVTSVRWQVHPVSERRFPAVDLRQARRRLTEEVQSVLERLYRLDVARPRPDAAELARRWQAAVPSASLPPGSDPLASDLLDRASHLRQVVALALGDEGGAVTGWEADERRQALRSLDRILLHVEAEAWNCGLPPDA